MDSDNRRQPTYARAVGDPRTSLHAFGPPRCWPPILPCMGRTPHCGRVTSRTRTRTTTNHGTRTTAGRLVELDSSHFGIRLIPTQAKASTSSSPTGRADSPASGVPRKLAGRSPGAASRHPSGTLLCLHVTKPGSDGQELTHLLPLDATRSSPCRRLGYIVTKGPVTTRIQPADHQYPLWVATGPGCAQILARANAEPARRPGARRPHGSPASTDSPARPSRLTSQHDPLLQLIGRARARTTQISSSKPASIWPTSTPAKSGQSRQPLIVTPRFISITRRRFHHDNHSSFLTSARPATFSGSLPLFKQASKTRVKLHG